MLIDVLVTTTVFLIVFTAIMKHGMAAVRDAEWWKERQVQMKMDQKRWGGDA